MIGKFGEEATDSRQTGRGKWRRMSKKHTDIKLKIADTDTHMMILKAQKKSTSYR